MTWSTDGISRPLAATSVAINTPLDEEANLQHEEWYMSVLVGILNDERLTCRDSLDAAFAAVANAAGRREP